MPCWVWQAHSRDCNLHCARVPFLPIWAGACQVYSIPIWVLNPLGVPDVLVKALGATMQGVTPIVGRHAVDRPVQRKTGTLNPVCAAPHEHAKVRRRSILQGQGQLSRCCRFCRRFLSDLVLQSRASRCAASGDYHTPAECMRPVGPGPAVALLEAILYLLHSWPILQGQTQPLCCFKHLVHSQSSPMLCWHWCEPTFCWPVDKLWG